MTGARFEARSVRRRRFLGLRRVKLSQPSICVIRGSNYFVFKFNLSADYADEYKIQLQIFCARFRNKSRNAGAEGARDGAACVDAECRSPFKARSGRPYRAIQCGVSASSTRTPHCQIR
jgi:hypothetical protein